MNVTKGKSKGRQLQRKGQLQKVTAEQREYAEASACRRIAENTNIITELQTAGLLEKILHRDNFNLTALKEYMTMYLTEFMIPEFFVTLDKLPLTVNGKLNKDRLPVPKRIKIKNANIQDLDLLLNWRMEVLSNVFREEFKLLTAEQINAIRENNRRYYLSEIPSGGHIACFAYRDGEIVGCGGVCIYDEMPSPDNLGGKCAYLMNIYTREEYRHQGIATRIVEHLIAEAKARNIEKIYLETSADGERMYRRLGFKDMKGYMKL